jgi:hypothetical protein
MAHGLLSFRFDTIVLALTINLAAGLLQAPAGNRQGCHCLPSASGPRTDKRSPGT